MRWKLEDGSWVTPEDLAEEITRVPRTRYWRLSHLAFLWPETADPGRHDLDINGFGEGFVLEIVPKGVEAAFERMESWVREREAARETSPEIA